jgi:hypothetical protein
MAKDKVAKAPQQKKARQKKPSRIKQIGESYRLTKATDPRIGLILLGVFLGVGIVIGGLAYLLTQGLVYCIVLGVLSGLLAALVVFGRRAQRSAISQIEGKPGAAASVLGLLRRGWKVEPGIAFNKNQDVAHRLVGPPGIVLIGEGNPNRLRPMLTNEHRKHERVVSETTITEVLVGDGPGQVSLHKLVKHVSKLPKTLKPAEMTDVLARLKALDSTRSNIPLPKGPVPTSMKGARQNQRGR